MKAGSPTPGHPCLGRCGDLEEDDIIAFCREQLAHFKAPKTVVFGPLPKTSTGKVQKFKLRERLADP